MVPERAKGVKRKCKQKGRQVESDGEAGDSVPGATDQGWNRKRHAQGRRPNSAQEVHGAEAPDGERTFFQSLQDEKYDVAVEKSHQVEKSHRLAANSNAMRPRTVNVVSQSRGRHVLMCSCGCAGSECGFCTGLPSAGQVRECIQREKLTVLVDERRTVGVAHKKSSPWDHFIDPPSKPSSSWDQFMDAPGPCSGWRRSLS